MKRLSQIIDITAPRRVEASPPSCERCQDRGWVMVDDGGAGRAARCECARGERPPEHWQAMGMPRRLAQVATRDAWRSDWAPWPTALDEWDPREHWGVILAGEVGIGKSFAAAVAAKERGARYWLSAERVNETMLARWDNDDQARAAGRALMAELKDPRLIVIDDLGASEATKTARDAVIAGIKHREGDWLPTIFTTNARRLEACDRRDRRSLDWMLGARVASRLRGCQWVTMAGKDRRGQQSPLRNF